MHPSPCKVGETRRPMGRQLWGRQLCQSPGAPGPTWGSPGGLAATGHAPLGTALRLWAWPSLRHFSMPGAWAVLGQAHAPSAPSKLKKGGA